MQQAYPAWVRMPGWVPVMPTPGPLGRLIARRRRELVLTQPELAELTRKYGPGISQNNISRLESGKTQRINDPDRIASLGKALGLESDVEFILAAYAPAIVRDQIEILPPGPDGELVALVRRIPDERKPQAMEILKTFVSDKESGD